MSENFMDSEQEILTFPCDFPIKAMGKVSDGFNLLVLEIVQRHAPDIQEDAVKSRMSSGGKFISVTVTVRATSKAQLDNIYLDLTAHEQVIMAL
jgi:putative lipoic acid-binding regulatory protein